MTLSDLLALGIVVAVLWCGRRDADRVADHWRQIAHQWEMIIATWQSVERRHQAAEDLLARARAIAAEHTTTERERQS